MNQTWTRQPSKLETIVQVSQQILNSIVSHSIVSVISQYLSISHKMDHDDDHGLDIWDLITLKLCESCAPVAHFVSHFARQHETLMQSAGRGSFLAKLLVMIVLRIVCYHCSSCRKSVSNEQISFPLTHYMFASNCTEWSRGWLTCGVDGRIVIWGPPQDFFFHRLHGWLFCTGAA